MVHKSSRIRISQKTIFVLNKKSAFRGIVPRGLRAFDKPFICAGRAMKNEPDRLILTLSDYLCGNPVIFSFFLRGFVFFQ